MDETKLRYFISVVQHMSFTKAAKDRHVVQSTVSKQIASLEEELGVQLFYREGTNLRLTPVGRRLADSVDNYLSRYKSIEENIASLVHRSERRVQLSIGPYEFPLAARLQAAFRPVQPDVEFYPVCNSYRRTASLLQAHTLALALCIGQCAVAAPSLPRVSLGKSRWLPVARKDHPFWDLPRERQLRLEGQLLLTLKNVDNDPISAYTRQHDMAPNSTCSVGYYMSAMAMLQAGGCLALLPEYLEPWLGPDLRMDGDILPPLEAETLLICDPAQASPAELEFFEFVKNQQA